MTSLCKVKRTYRQDKTNVAITWNHTVVITGEWKFRAKQHDYILQGQEADQNFAQRQPSYFCVKQLTLNWLPISSQSAVKSNQFTASDFMKFTIFTASLRTFWRFSGIFFTTSAYMWLMQWLLPILGTILLTWAVSLLCFLVTDFALSVAVTNPFIPWQSLFFEIRVN